jgi:Tol biopolymer transport system component
MYTAWLDSRTLIYSADDGAGQALYAMDVERLIPHRVTSGFAEQYMSVAVSVSRPPRLVATVANPTASLWSVPISDRIQTEDMVSRVPTPPAKAQAPRLGPGYLLFLSSKGGGKGLWKLENGAAREIWKGSDGGVMAAPAISPDGTKICFSYRKQGREGLYVMNADGTSVRALVDSFSVRGIASWSPDGKWIAAAGNQGNGTSIFKIPVDGGPPVRLLDTLSYHPVWSPDGKRIIYAEPQLGGGTLPVKAITPDGTPVPMPDIEVTYLGSPYRFVPHTNLLVFLKANADISKRNFYLVDLDTGKQSQLTDLKPGSLLENFDVSPDGKQIVFDRLRANSDIVLIDLSKKP